MNPEMKSLSETKLRYGFQKNVKFHFCPVFWAIFWFYQQFHCKIYIWRWSGPNLIFFMVISITLYFQIKKIQILKIYPPGFNLSFWNAVEKILLLQPYARWIEMKTYCPTNFASPPQSIGQYISHSY